jgi:glutathionyl-hydroquinone reductase
VRRQRRELRATRRLFGKNSRTFTRLTRLRIATAQRELYSVPGVAATTKPRNYVINFYSILALNPTGIIPMGTPVDLGQPHDRSPIAT